MAVRSDAGYAPARCGTTASATAAVMGDRTAALSPPDTTLQQEPRNHATSLLYLTCTSCLMEMLWLWSLSMSKMSAHAKTVCDV